MKDYQRTDNHFCQLKNYNLTYTMYKLRKPDPQLPPPPIWRLLDRDSFSDDQPYDRNSTPVLASRSLAEVPREAVLESMEYLRCGNVSANELCLESPSVVSVEKTEKCVACDIERNCVKPTPQFATVFIVPLTSFHSQGRKLSSPCRQVFLWKSVAARHKMWRRHNFISLQEFS